MILFVNIKAVSVFGKTLIFKCLYKFKCVSNNMNSRLCLNITHPHSSIARVVEHKTSSSIEYAYFSQDIMETNVLTIIRKRMLQGLLP